MVAPDVCARTLTDSVDACGCDTLILGTDINLVLVSIQATLLNVLLVFAEVNFGTFVQGDYYWKIL